MICDLCKERPAAVHFTQIINNKKTELNLCNECAGKQNQIAFGIKPQISLPNFLAGLFEQNLNMQRQAEDKATEKCPNCGIDYRQFTKRGLMGCDKCYETFSGQTDLLLRKIHGSNIHGGKVPKRTGGNIKLKKEISSLRIQLQEVIVKEDFERAAELRDQIKKLETSNRGD